MADNSTILKEFLVAIGFKVDQGGLNKIDAALGKTAKAAFAFAGILLGTTAAATAFVDKVATKMEDLYWTSVRLRDGAANIQDFRLEVSKLGGDADQVTGALENFSGAMRTNPAAEGLLHQLGIQTRDAKGNLRSNLDMAREFSKLPMPHWLKVKMGQQYFGMDERSLMAIQRLAPDAGHKLSELYKRAGIDADKATDSSRNFRNRLRDVEGESGVLAVALETHLLPAANGLLSFAETAINVLATLDNVTGGFSTNLITLTGVIWGVNTAMSVAFGGTIIKMLSGIALWLATLTTAAFPAVSEAILAVGAAIELTPIGWVITAVAALGAAAFLVIEHWDKVKEYFLGFMNYLKDKWNAVAKFFGLPEISAGPASSPGGEPPAGTGEGAPPDYRQREKNRGPNSMPGQEAQPDKAQGAAVSGKALAFFEKAGWTANQAAGIVANLVHESAMNPTAKGDYVNGKPSAYGIAQWHPDRQAAFKAWSGKDIHDATLDEQLAFVQQELSKGSKQFAGKLLAGAQTAAQAGAVVSQYYEAPKDPAGLKAAQRASTAEKMASGTRLAPAGGRLPPTMRIEQHTDIQVTGGDPQATGRAVAREQGRVNGDLVRNFAGAHT